MIPLATSKWHDCVRCVAPDLSAVGRVEDRDRFFRTKLDLRRLEVRRRRMRLRVCRDAHARYLLVMGLVAKLKTHVGAARALGISPGRVGQILRAGERRNGGAP